MKLFPDIDLNWLLTGEGTLVKDDPDSMFTGSLFGDNLLNATKSTTESENRKENSLETAKNTDNPIVKQEIIYKEKPVRKIAEIRIFFDDGTYETFTPNK